MSEPFWKPHERTSDHWFEVVRYPYGEGQDHERNEFVVKWDGCCHLHEYATHYGADAEGEQPQHDWYIHTDDLDGFIDMLIELRERAIAHYEAVGNYDDNLLPDRSIRYAKVER
jgi:hypothetical protein